MMPMYSVAISQKENGSYSHQGINAIDLCGKDSGIDKVYAPCDCKAVKKFAYVGMGNAVVFQSISKVLFADGTLNYATFLMMHDNNISDIRVGQTFKQGAKCYDEGKYGYATGNHIHFEVKKGTYAGLASNGWSLKGNMNTQNALWLLEGKHKVINLLGNKYKVADSPTTEEVVIVVKPRQLLAVNGRVVLKADRALYTTIPKKATKYTKVVAKGAYFFNGYYIHEYYKGVDFKGNKCHFVALYDINGSKLLGYIPIYAGDQVEENQRKVKEYVKI